MSDQPPYTIEDLIAEAARQHAVLTKNPDFMGVGEAMQDSAVASLAPQHAAKDIDGQPNDADGVTWQQLLPFEADACEAYDLAQNRVYDLIRDAADLSKWAVNLGARGLEPVDTALVTSSKGEERVRLHFAFAPDMDERRRQAVIDLVADAIRHS